MAVYAIAHNKGGAGKTTSTVHILPELKPDVVIDLDVHKGISIINKFRPDDIKWPVLVISDKRELLATLQELEENGRTVLIDCGGFDADITRAAVAVADVVIVPANDSMTEMLGLSTFDHTLAAISKQMGVNIQAKLMLCKTHPNQVNFPDIDELLNDTKHITRMTNRLSYRTGRYGFQDSVKKGLGITEIRHGRSSAAGKEVVAVVEEMKQLAHDL